LHLAVKLDSLQERWMRVDNFGFWTTLFNKQTKHEGGKDT
jgi:hypothetical protein